MKGIRIVLLSFLLIGMLFGFGTSQNNTASAGLLQNMKIGSDLVPILQNTLDPVEVIVTFDSEGGPGLNDVKLLKSLGISQGILLESLPMAGVLATPAQVELLANSDDVVSIYLNKTLEYENDEATDLTGVDKLRTDENMQKLNDGLPITGKGVGVLINDSGVDGTHKDIEYGNHLVQNVLGSTNLHAQSELLPISYVEDVPATDNNSGHGTHVAGIVGGTGAMSGGLYEGVAPGANLIGYGSGAALAMLDTIGGFDYALTHQNEYNIRVVTNSWGDTGDAGTPFDPKNPINIATKKLFDRGIITVFSAGNSGPDADTISGNYKKAPWVITVAAGDKEGNLADFSSRGLEGNGGTVTVEGETWNWEDRPTITAPGSKIISTRVISPVASLGAADDVQYIDPAYIPYYTTMSGTSMAAPHVAGVVALILEADKTLSPLEVKKIIEDTATPMSGYASWEVGAGYVNAYDAVEKAFKLSKTTNNKK
ncbi:S8 family serine peptidase [Pseudalkalibacillus caeni]|uniref:Peptidase S8 n=1 Tax=Exobacillus caeni TaxID=2574798 RepID=A0A5R9F6H0_9BACL|nr:S8 family serine peptidase [Pseudalkalibacillus caeni]TLS36074.1 peptidase S8 [Pseudalkalibacillus caeni]